MQFLRSIAAAIGQVWSKGCLGKGAIIFVALIVLGMCGSIMGGGRRAAAPSTTPPPTIAAVAAQATTAPEPTAAQLPSPELTIAAEPIAAPEPTTAAPTRTPMIIPTLAGAAPKGSDCPADHPVKGNIVDRGDNKGDKIYHLPSSSSYQATKPERCFVDATEAESAGFRAPK